MRSGPSESLNGAIGENASMRPRLEVCLAIRLAGFLRGKITTVRGRSIIRSSVLVDIRLFNTEDLCSNRA